ncbi:DUF6636 domain-containing protein [Psychromarinibacter sp. S121]|uniref:DUF6636 domain-containing protein n=1 Tax=Psychromarinibacter sp. S121 TaxID=3415127 RepID=UPI003C7E47E4
MRLFAVLLLAAATPATAQDAPLPDLPFQSGAGEVFCVIVTGERNHVRCDLYGGELTFADPPQDCEAGWGYAFEVGITGSGKVLCTDDTVIDETIQVMEPGYSHSRGGVACFSEDGGMTCLNAENLGFTLRQDEQVLY